MSNQDKLTETPDQPSTTDHQRLEVEMSPETAAKDKSASTEGLSQTKTTEGIVCPSPSSTAQGIPQPCMIKVVDGANSSNILDEKYISENDQYEIVVLGLDTSPAIAHNIPSFDIGSRPNLENKSVKDLDVEPMNRSKNVPVLCLYCYEYFGKNMHKHACRQMLEASGSDIQEKRKKTSQAFRTHHQNMVKHVFFKESEIPEKNMYSKTDVIEILKNFGHKLILEKEKPKMNKGKTNANALVSDTVNDETENQSQIDTPFRPVYKKIAPRSLEGSLADQTIILEQYGLTKGSLETIAIPTTDSIAIQTTESVDESTDVENMKIYTAVPCEPGPSGIETQTNASKSKRKILDMDMNVPHRLTKSKKDDTFLRMSFKVDKREKPRPKKRASLLKVNEPSQKISKLSTAEAQCDDDEKDQCMQNFHMKKSVKFQRKSVSIESLGDIDNFDDSDNDPDYNLTTEHSSDSKSSENNGEPEEKKLKTLKSVRKRTARATATKERNKFKADSFKHKLQSKGVYNIPDEYKTHNILHEFETVYLQKANTSSVKSKSHIVTNVTRVMFHINDDEDEGVTIGITKRKCETEAITFDKLCAYLDNMKDIGYSSGTILNYIKHFKHFVKYLTTVAKLYQTNKAEYDRLLHELLNLNLLASRYKAAEKLKIREQRAVDPKRLDPPTVYEVQTIIRAAEPKAKEYIAHALVVPRPHKNVISYINSYLGVLMSMGHGHRSGILEDMRFVEYTAAIGRTRISNGETFHCISIAHHKTGKSGLGKIALSEEQFNLFSDYVKIRAKLVQSTTETFLVNGKGEPFNKMAEGIKRLYKKCNVSPIYTATQARRAFETFYSNAPAEKQDCVATYMCHSSDMADERYRGADFGEAVKAFVMMEKASTYSKDNKEVPDKDYFVPTVSQLDDEVAGPSSVNLDLAEQTVLHQTCKSVGLFGKVKTAVGSVVGKINPANAKSPKQKGPKSKSPFSPDTVAIGITSKYLDTLGTITSQTNLPTIQDIKLGNTCTKTVAKKVHDKLSYHKRSAVHSQVADKILTAEARRRNTKMSCLTEVPSIPKDDLLQKYSDGNAVYLKDLNVKLKHRLDHWKTQSSNPQLTVENLPAIEELIKNQQWPNLTVSVVKDIGKGVIVKEHKVEKGTVLCDYHGYLLNKHEGEKKLREYKNTTNSQEGNYFYFFTEPRSSKQMCIDAASFPCSCHPEMETFGRLINHSKKVPNLKPTTVYIKDKPVILLISNKTIEPLEEIRYDYGVTKDEDDNTVIDFLADS